MKERFLLLVALGIALVALPTVALGSTARASSNSQSFPDSTGENPNAPDITSVDVSNDDAGNITFKVNISNRPALTADMAILIYLNTDQNSATGDPQSLGADYVIQLIPGAIGLFQWNGSDYVAAQSQTSLIFSYDTTGPTIHISANDLGKTKAFGFLVEAISGITTDASGNPDLTNAQVDVAPDPGHGLYSYSVLTKLTLTQTAFTTVPNPAKAGKRFTATMAATESDTGGPITSATIKCAATVGTKRLPATHSLANGVVSCFFKLPKTAKGKTLHGTITITVQGTTLTKTYVVRIH